MGVGLECRNKINCFLCSQKQRNLNKSELCLLVKYLIQPQMFSNGKDSSAYAIGFQLDLSGLGSYLSKTQTSFYKLCIYLFI